MPIGPGKYGANAEKLLEEYGGSLCIVVLVGAPDGPAFDVATTTPALLANVPELLRRLADGIQADLEASAANWPNFPKARH